MKSIPVSSKTRLQRFVSRAVTTLALSVFAPTALTTGCADVSDEAPRSEPGRLRVGLSAEIHGVRYHLEGTFQVSGAQDVTLTTAAQDLTLTTVLEPGSYSVTLLPGFKILRELNGGLVPIEGELASPSMQAFEITSAATTAVSYQFSLNGGTVEFGPGELRIDVGFVEGGAGCSDGAIAHPSFRNDLDFPAPTTPAQIIYASNHDRLVLRSVHGDIAVLDLASGAVTTHAAVNGFYDMSLSPDGNYVFAADYGGEVIGYGSPLNQSYVHRLDLATNQWDQKQADIAGHIQATSSDKFILMALDQWVSFTYNLWTDGPAVAQLSSEGWISVYQGDFRYDATRGRLIHGNSGLSSQEIQAFAIVNDEFAYAEGSGTYGSASGHGGTVALATDGSAFYYGNLSVDAANVASNRTIFPDLIHAASGAIAFGDGRYFDAQTGAPLGDLGFRTTVYGLKANGLEFWTFDAGAGVLRRFKQAVICLAGD